MAVVLVPKAIIPCSVYGTTGTTGAARHSTNELNSHRPRPQHVQNIMSLDTRIFIFQII